MKLALIPTLIAAATLSRIAAGQAITHDTHVTYALAWAEHNGNANGILEPGESALITMDISFTNQFGPAAFSPPIGQFTTGTILGFSHGFLDLNSSGGTHGAFNYSSPLANAAGTSGFGVRGGWRISGSASNGTPNAAGTGLDDIAPGQWWQVPESINTQNPVTNLYRLLWTPDSYAAREVRFDLSAAVAQPHFSAAIAVGFGGGLSSSIYVAESSVGYGSISIPIVPAPAALPLFLAMVLPRRRPHARLLNI